MQFKIGLLCRLISFFPKYIAAASAVKQILSISKQKVLRTPADDPAPNLSASRRIMFIDSIDFIDSTKSIDVTASTHYTDCVDSIDSRESIRCIDSTDSIDSIDSGSHHA